jgi:hypothetical protein
VTAPCIGNLPYQLKFQTAFNVSTNDNKQLTLSMMNDKLHGLLLRGSKSNQSHFSKNLFHRVDVIVSIEVTREKFLFFTGFAHRK